MAYEFTAPQGQGQSLHTLVEAGLPPLTDYRLETHAPYDPAADIETLFLSRGDAEDAVPIKHDATSIVSYVPGQSIDIASTLSVPARRILVGEHRLVYNAVSPIGGLVIKATMANTSIKFLGAGSNGRNEVVLTGLSAETAVIAAGGLVFATAEKLKNRKRAGWDFAAQAVPSSL